VNAVLVNHRYHPFQGGSEIYIKTVAEWLLSNGVDTRVVTTNAWDLEYFWDPRARPAYAPSRDDVCGIPVRRLEVGHPPLSRYAFPPLRRLMGESSRASRWAKPFDLAAALLPQVPGLVEAIVDGPVPDIIVTTNLSLEGLATVASATSRTLGARLVVIPFAHVGGVDDAKARRYVSMPHQRGLLRSADLVLTMTDLERCFVEELGVEPFRAVFVGAGIEESAVTGGCAGRFRAKLGSTSPIVAFIGAQAADKGTCDLVEATGLLRWRGVPLELVLIGPELSGFRDWMERSGADGWPWVHRLGVVDEGVKRDLLAAMTLLAVPSRTESFGIVYLEAWANQKPVLGARVGAVTEVVDHGTDGFLVPFGDPAAIANAIGDLLADPERRAQMGIAGYRKVQRLYTWDRVLGRIGSAFEDVLGMRIDGSRAS
jgi:glycosyltransferase involved in cell wall biosynthesis